MKIIKENNTVADYNIQDDLFIIESVLGLDKESLMKEVGITNLNSRDSINKIYNYCYENDLYLNEIKWLGYKEEITNSSNILLCHGSRSGIVGNIRVDITGGNNDFGDGFYCGENLKQAGMFVSEDPDSSLYILSFRKTGLKAATFTVSNDWMFAVAYNRGIIDKYKNSPIIKRVVDKIDNADYVIAPIADNRIFELIDAFVAGYLTDKQTRFALASTHLGYQYVFKKPECISHLKVLEHCPLCDVERAAYNKIADAENMTSLNKALIAKKKFEGEGKYIDELLTVTEDLAAEQRKKPKPALSRMGLVPVKGDDASLARFNQGFANAGSSGESSGGGEGASSGDGGGAGGGAA